MASVLGQISAGLITCRNYTSLYEVSEVKDIQVVGYLYIWLRLASNVDQI